MGLSDAEVQRQIQQMAGFIKQEADEKASEIMVKAEEEFNIEKARMVQEERLRIMADYGRREQQVEVQKRIAMSNQVNQARLRVLRLRNDLVHEAFVEAQRRLVEISADRVRYQKLLKELIIESLIKLTEKKVELLCRKCDVDIVAEVLPAALAAYKEKTGLVTEVNVSKKHFLPPAPSAEREGNSCAGGIVVSVDHGKIILSNTLDQRVELAFDMKLPEVRTLLFGKK